MLRNLFNQRHPFIMQAIGGLIAFVIFVPIAAWVVFDIINSKAPETAAIAYAPPANQALQNNAPPAYTGNGSKGNTSTGAPKNGGQDPNSGATVCSTKTCTVKMQPGQGLYVFAPCIVLIIAGSTGKWVDVNAVPHNIIGTDNHFINKQTPNADSYTLTFAKKGTFNYNCTLHLPTMIGRIGVR